ncbi:MAG: hypothetical protein JWR38_216 [Mucilaginibacter sp.]|nr:hypothetical protein [Mucilaginibacter sp.]
MKLSKYLIIVLFISLNAVNVQGQKMEVVNKYMPTDLTKDTLFITYFNNFKKLVRNNDKDGLANLISYDQPKLHVTLDKIGGKPNETIYKTINNRNDFLILYPRIFDRRMREMLAKQEIKDLSLMSEGIMLNRGQVWWRYYKDKNKIVISFLANSKTVFPPKS